MHTEADSYPFTPANGTLTFHLSTTVIINLVRASPPGKPEMAQQWQYADPCAKLLL